MTIGTGIVISVGIIAAAWIVTLCIGAWFANKKQNVTQKLTNEIAAKIIAHRDKK
jgi:uncharacterized membrane protein (DUF485 family)